MYKVSVNSITFGRRTYEKGAIISEKQIPGGLLKELEKSGKIEKQETKKTSK